MVGTFPLKRRSPFVYPGTPAGIDFTHSAAKGLQFSGISRGAQFVNLLNGKRGTITGSITSGIDGTIGPYAKNSNTSANIAMAGVSTVATSKVTLAAIVVTGSNTANNWLFVGHTMGATASPTIGCVGGSNTLVMYSDTGGPFVDSLLPMAASTPYFVAVSYPATTGNINFVVTNLRNGKVTQASIANTFSSVASNGSACVLGTETGDASDCSVGAAMYSTAGLSPADLKAWSIDPWSFWYPVKPDIGLMLAPSASGAVNVNITGVNATAAVGTPTVTGFGNVTLTGINATAAAGTATVSAKANFTLTGVSATTAVNVPTITAAANVFPTGVVATTAVNVPTVTGFANVTFSGVNATAAAGDVTVSVGGAISVNLTGVNATAAVGTPTVTGFANVSITGIAATAQIGTLTTSAASNVSITGVAASSEVNTPTVTGFANVTLSGVLATVAAGNITVSVPTAVSVTLSGVSASAQVGTLSTNFDIDSSTRGTETVLTDHKRGVGSYLTRKRWLELREQFKAEDEAKATKKAREAVRDVKADIVEAIDAGIVPESYGPSLASLAASAESAEKTATALHAVAQIRAELKAIHELNDDDEILGMAMKQFPDFFFGGRF